MVFVMAADNSGGFGFLRTNDAIPQYPITTDDPQCDGYNVSRTMLVKKLGRLAIAFDKDVGIKATTGAGTLSLETVSERVSKDSMECKVLKQEIPDLSFVFDYKLMKSVISQFQASNLDMYIDKFKCTLVSQAELEMVDTKERKPFKAVALISLARTV
jgi:hypothetical protein